MNIFNRIVMILAILVLVLAVAFVLVRPLDAVDGIKAALAFFEQMMLDDQLYLLFLIGSSVVLLFLVILLTFEFRRPRHKTVRVIVPTAVGGNVQLDIASVAQNLEYRIDELPGVRQVVSRIVSHGRDIDVALDLDTSPTVNIPELTELVVKMCRDIAEGQLGLKVRGKVRVNIHHEPYPSGALPPAQTQPVASAPSPIVAAPEPFEPAPVAESAEPAAQPPATEEPAPSAPSEKP
jgi:hypothetical protein